MRGLLMEKRLTPVAAAHFLFLVLLGACFFFLFAIQEKAHAKIHTAAAIAEYGDVTVMAFTGPLDADQVDGVYALPIQAITGEFYKTHADRYDFLVIYSGFDFQMPPSAKGVVAGFYHGVRNDVQGTGRPLFDNTSHYGGAAGLQGVIVMGSLKNKVSDPFDPGFTHTMTTLSHEILHQWAAYTGFQDSDGTVSRALLDNEGRHWSFLLHTQGSLMYGNAWQDNGNHTFTSLPGRKYYSPLDLYLMGMIDKSRVPPMLLIENPDIDPDRLPLAGITIPGEAGTITIDDIIAVEGERIPSVEDSQKRFKVGTIVLVRPGEPHQALAAQARSIMDGWRTWFSGLTDGRGMVEYAAAPIQHRPENPGLDAPPYDPRTAPPEIADGVAWLRADQNSDGSWQDTGLTAPRDTALALMALSDFSNAQTNCQDGLGWLTGIVPANSDYLARKAETLVSFGESCERELAELKRRQNPDGGWGVDETKYDSNPLDTAVVLKALSAGGCEDAGIITPAVDYLVSVQRDDGGWGCDEYDGDIRTTAHAIRALGRCAGFGSPEASIQHGLARLYEQQHPGGGFGDNAGTVYDTALALMSLRELNGDQAVRAAAIDFILDTQSQNGSWYGSAYQTALAVAAIWEERHEPDLVVTTADISFMPETIIRVPSTVTIQAEIGNQGLTDVPQVEVALYEGVVSESNRIDSRTVAVAGNSATGVAFEVEIVSGRSHHFFIDIDGASQIAESCKTNNTALKILHPATTCDFEIRNDDITVSPAVANLLDAVTITTCIRNNGAADAYNVPVRFYADEEEILAATLDCLPAGGEVVREVTWVANRPGTFPISAVVDPDDVFENELSGDNNRGSTDITVNPSTLPNLFVSQESIHLAPDPPLRGSDLEITVAVGNNGFAPVEDVNVTFYAGVPGQGGTIVGTKHLPSLSPDEIVPVTVTWENLSSAGKQVIYVEVLAPDLVEEIRQADNTAFITTHILNLPDLAVSSAAIAVEPPIAREGDTVSILASIQNLGDQIAENFDVVLLEEGVVIDTARIDAIPGHTAFAATFTCDTTGKKGAYDITVVIDPDHVVVEQDRSNNIASRGFLVQDADLWLTERYFSPNGDGIKDTTRFFFNLTSPRTVHVAVVNDDNRVVRRFDGPAFAETAGGDIVWDGLDDSGRLVADGDYRIQVRSGNDSVIAFLPVTVDNNRSPLSAAIGTDYLYNVNITRPLPYLRSDDWQWFSDQSGILFYIDHSSWGAPEYSRGLYTMASDGSNINRLVPYDWTDQYYVDYELSPDGTRVAMALENVQYQGVSENQIWTVDRNGNELYKALSWPDKIITDDGREELCFVTGLSFSPDGNTIACRLLVYEQGGYFNQQGRLYLVGPDGSGSRQVAETSAGFNISNIVWHPDNSALAYVGKGIGANWSYDDVFVTDVEGDAISSFSTSGSVEFIDWVSPRSLTVVVKNHYGSYDIWLMDATGAESHNLIAGGIRINNDWALGTTGSGFVYIDEKNSIWTVNLCDYKGNCRVLYEAAEQVHAATHIGDLRWSPDGNSLAFMDYFYALIPDMNHFLYKSAVIVVDVITGEVKAYEVGIRDPYEGLDSYHIYTGLEGGWKKAGVLHYAEDFFEQELDLSGVERDKDGSLNVRIVQQGMDEAFIRKVRMVADGKAYQPTRVVDAVSGMEIPAELFNGGNPVDAHGKTFIMTWDNLPAFIHDLSLELTANEISHRYQFGSLRWLGNDVLLGLEVGSLTERIFAVNLADGVKARLLTDDVYAFETSFEISPLSNAITWEQPSDIWLVRSLLNLTADLHVTRTDAALVLRGTAMDLNFDYYILEYASINDPQNWRPVAPPVSTPRVDEEFIKWIPPEEGLYYVRLTVSDKAGNSAGRRQRVAWGSSTSITHLYKTGVTFTDQGDVFSGDGDFISPYTDSSQSGVAVHYTVQKPVRLEAAVFDPAGNRINTFYKDYPALSGPVADYIVWDGRDASGTVVADGIYTFKVLDYEFFVRVDRTPPGVDIALGAKRIDIPTDEKPEATGEITATLSYAASDDNLCRFIVEYGRGVNPRHWYEYDSTEAGRENIFEDEHVYADQAIESLIDRTFRITAVDAAGNTATMTTDHLLRESFTITRWMGPSHDWYVIPSSIKYDTTVPDAGSISGLPIVGIDPGKNRLQGLETISAPITGLVVQYRDGSMVWRDDVVFENPDSGIFTLPWDNSQPPVRDANALRLRAVDGTGVIHFSSPIILKTVEPRQDNCRILYDQYVTGLESLEFQVAKVSGKPRDPIPIDNPEKPAWEVYNAFRVSAGDAIPLGEGFVMPLPGEFDRDSNYRLRIVGFDGDGPVIISSLILFPLPTGCYDENGDDENGDDENGWTFNLELFPVIETPFGPDLCGCYNTAVAVSSSYTPAPPENFKSISYYRGAEADRILLAGSDNPLEPLVIDIREYSVGETVTAEIEFGRNGLVRKDIKIPDRCLDNELPRVRVGYPGSSARICRIREADSSGKVRHYIDVEGFVSDNMDSIAAPDSDGLYQWRLYYGRDAAPGVWVLTGLGGTRPVAGNMGRWDVTDLGGDTYYLKLVASDFVGNVNCFTTGGFYLKSVGERLIADAVVVPTLFSPNNDGLFDTLAFDFTLADDARVTIVAGQGDTVVATLDENRYTTAGTHQLVWDGSGLADGVYDLVITAGDVCGQIEERTIAGVTIDTTPPTSRITSPGPGDSPGIIVEVWGSAVDDHFSTYRLEAAPLDYPDDTVVINESDTPVKSGLLGTWNTRGLSGDWMLRLESVDRAGNSSQDTMTLELGDRQDLILDLAVSPPIFSPNNDGRWDETEISYTLNQDVNDNYQVIIRISGDDGPVRSRQWTDVEPGHHQYIWDGRDDAQPAAVVPDGRYQVRVEVHPVGMPTFVHQETVTVAVDGTLPVIDITAPVDQTHYRGDVPVSGSITDDNLESYRITCHGDAGEVVGLEGKQNRVEYLFTTLSDPDEGEYLLAVSATDAAGNEAEDTISFVVDRTPPRSQFISPEADAIYGGDAPLVTIAAVIEEENIADWTLAYGYGEAPESRVELVSGTSLPEEETLLEWAVGPDDDIPDGLYTLFLKVTDKAGWERDISRLVRVDNTPPEIVVGSLLDGDYVTVPGVITGSVKDDNLLDYTVFLSPRDCAGPGGWSIIHEGRDAVDGGGLVELDHLPSDGPYCLKLVARDRAGHTAEKTTGFIIDTQPPSAPLVSLEREDRTGCLLSWEAVADEDLAGYIVYRNGQPLTGLMTETGYGEAGLDEGRYVYTVIAVDHAGWESRPSNAVEFMADLTGPTVRLAHPGDGGLLNDLVEIRGTAYSEDDFKQYRVYFGTGADPTDWNLIRTSPVPVPYGVLAELSQPLSGGVYAVKLEAEDLVGNTSRCRSVFTVDDVPPSAPVLLSAVADGADVLLSWQAVEVDDLAGYLLYRNNEPVNAAGPVVGDLKPYLLTETNYLDSDLVDGTFTYYLEAMDLAGNISLPSESLTVTIDMRAPQAAIVSPAHGQSFEHPLMIRAECPDLDIAQIRIQYLGAESLSWTDLGAPLAAPPYSAWLDPAEEGMSYGNYHIRAVAEDISGNIDPEPAEIMVTYTDLTPPAVPVGLAALVNGGDITFSWQANTEADLAGYNIYKLGEENYRLNQAPLTDTGFSYADAADDQYTFAISAVDTFGNESELSEDLSMIVYTPVVEQPFTPVCEMPVMITGSGVVPASEVSIYSNTEIGSELLAQVEADAYGEFTAETSLAEGENVITAVARDAAGNTSRESDMVVVVYGPIPPVPTGLTALPPEEGGFLTWDPAHEEDTVIGYHIFRDGQPVNPPVRMRWGGTSASRNNESAWRAFDDNSFTAWHCGLTDEPGDFVWWQVQFEGGIFISEVTVDWQSAGGGEEICVLEENGGWNVNGEGEGWEGEEGNVNGEGEEGGSGDASGGEGSPDGAGPDFDLQVWTGYSWLTYAAVTDNASLSNHFIFDRLYPTDRVRLVVYNTGDLNPEEIGLAEVTIMRASLFSGTNFIDEGVTSGAYAYEISAVNQYGFESGRTESVTVIIGDIEPPQAPAGLTAELVGNDVTLSWQANTEPDLAGYRVYRDSGDGLQPLHPELSLETEPAFTDTGLKNGRHTYHVTAVDESGNESEPASIAVEFFIAVPDQPEITAITTNPEGGMIRICWSVPAGDSVTFNLYRGETPGGPYVRVNSETLTEACHVDAGLTNDVTYYYTVTSVDNYGNESDYADEVGAVAADRISLSAPVILQPTMFGAPVGVMDWTIDISGAADAGSLVELFCNGRFAGETAAVRETWHKSRPIPLHDGLPAAVSVSPDEKSAAYMAGNLEEDGLFVMDIASGSIDRVRHVGGETVFSVFPNEPSARQYYQWSPDGNRLAYATRGWSPDGIVSTLEFIDVGWHAPVIVTETAGEIVFFRWSPDSDSLACSIQAQAGEDGPGRIESFIFDIAANGSTPLTGNQDDEVSELSPVWASDGCRLAFIRHSESNGGWLCMVDTETREVVELGEVPDNVRGLSFSPDDTRLALVRPGEPEMGTGFELDLVCTETGQVTATLPDVVGDGWPSWSGNQWYQWSPTSNQLLFKSGADVLSALYAYDVDSDRLVLLAGHVSRYDWDGSGLRVVSASPAAGGSLVEIRPADFPEGVRTIAHIDDDGGYFRTSTSGGVWYVAGHSDGGEEIPDGPPPAPADIDLRLLVPAGFSFEDVSLEPGENIFQALAVDSAGADSAWSLPVTVILEPDMLPDLELTGAGFFLYPRTPVQGETVIGSVVVANPSPIDVDTVVLLVQAFDSGGAAETVLIEYIDHLPASSIRLVDFSWSSRGLSGAYTFRAEVDPWDTVREAREDNNIAEHRLHVTGDHGPTLTLGLDDSRISRGGRAGITVHIVNSGFDREGYLEVWVSDAHDDTVAELMAESMLINYGDIKEITCGLDTGTVFEGDYTVHARLTDSGGVAVEDAALLTVDPDLSLAASLSTDSLVYGPNREVKFNAGIINTGGSVFSRAESLLTVTDGSHNQLVEEYFGPVEIYPGSAVTLDAAWNTGLHPPGEYRVQFQVYSEAGTLVCAAEGTFEIMADAVVTGTIEVSPSMVALGGAPGNDVRVDYTLTNTGNVAMIDIPVLIELQDSGSGAIKDTFQETISLQADDRFNGTLYFGTAALSRGDYTVNLRSGHSGTMRLLASGAFTVFDETPPTVTVLSPEADSLHHRSFSLAVSVRDFPDPVKSVEYAVDDGAWYSMPCADPAAGLYSVRYYPRQDDVGTRVFRFRAVDTGNRSAETTTVTVHIEPRLTMTAGLDADYYGRNQPVTAEIVMANTGWEKQVSVAAAIETAAGEAVFAFDTLDMTLAADGTTAFDISWDTDLHPGGDYRFRIEALIDDQAVADVTMAFAIQAVTNLTGTLALSPAAVLQGATTRFCYVITNPNAQAIEDVIIRVEVSDPDGGEPLASLQRMTSIGADSIVAADLEWAAEVEAGTYAVVLSAAPVNQAFRQAFRNLAEASLEVFERPEAEVEQAVAEDLIHLLVWMNDNCRVDCGDPGIFNLWSLLPGDCQWVNCVRDDLVAKILDQAGFLYRVVTSKEAFAKEIRNPVYSDVLILGDHQRPDCKTIAELMERVNAGMGIVSARWFQHTLEINVPVELTSIFGVRLDGLPFINDYTVVIDPSPISDEGLLDPVGKALRVKADSRAVIAGRLEREGGYINTPWGRFPVWGHFVDQAPAIVLHQYGLGRTVYFAFDLGLTLTDGSYETVAELLGNAVGYVHGGRKKVLPWDMVPVRIDIAAAGSDSEPASGDVYYSGLVSRDPSVEIFDPTAQVWITENPWIFEVDMEPHQPVEKYYYCLLPDIAGDHVLTTEIGLVFDDTCFPLDDSQLVLSVDVDRIGRYDMAIDAVNGLNVSWLQRLIIRKLVKKLEQIRDRPINACGARQELETSITELIGVIHSLMLLWDVDISEARLLLDDLLKMEQGRYYLYDRQDCPG